jgi:hypothetical protein
MNERLLSRSLALFRVLVQHLRRRNSSKDAPIQRRKGAPHQLTASRQPDNQTTAPSDLCSLQPRSLLG